MKTLGRIFFFPFCLFRPPASHTHTHTRTHHPPSPKVVLLNRPTGECALRGPWVNHPAPVHLCPHITLKTVVITVEWQANQPSALRLQVALFPHVNPHAVASVNSQPSSFKPRFRLKATRCNQTHPRSNMTVVESDASFAKAMLGTAVVAGGECTRASPVAEGASRRRRALHS